MTPNPDSPTERKIAEVMARGIDDELRDARTARANAEYNRAPRLSKDGKHYVMRTPDGKGYEINVPEADMATARKLLDLAQQKVRGGTDPKQLGLAAREADPSGRVGRMIFEQVEAAAKWDELQDQFATAMIELGESATDLEIRTDTRDEAEAMQRLINIIGNAEGRPADEVRYLVHELDPHGTLTRKALQQAQRELVKMRREHAAKTKHLQHLQADHAKTLAVKRSLDRYAPWEEQESFLLVLQPNDCSRIHKVREASNAGLYFDAAENKFCEMSDKLEKASVFVVRHDWAAAFGDSLKEGDPFKLPFDLCAFEFRVSGNTLIMMCEPLHDGEGGEGVNTLVIMEGVDGVWFTMPPDAMTEISTWLLRHVRAICVALEAEVAEHSVTRQPYKLNAKRQRAGKVPLRDFHVVDLSRRTRASARGESAPTGRKVRMHFRRGHWRHYEDHKTWIEWMLVGNPDLGFIDKEYRI